ncbi:MAG: hypothetical protein R2911_26175 [Caldilineaceae bacterium]
MAVQRDGEWKSAIKLSDSPAKMPNPGQKRLHRLYDERGKATADLLSLEDEQVKTGETLLLRHPTMHSKMRALRPDEVSAIEELMVDVVVNGKVVYDFPPLEAIRQVRQDDIDRLDPGIQRLVNPHIYHVSLTPKLWELKQQVIQAALGE